MGRDQEPFIYMLCLVYKYLENQQSGNQRSGKRHGAFQVFLELSFCDHQKFYHVVTSRTNFPNFGSLEKTWTILIRGMLKLGKCTFIKFLLLQVVFVYIEMMKIFLFVNEKFIVTSHCNNVTTKEITHKKNLNNRLVRDLLLWNVILSH